MIKRGGGTECGLRPGQNIDRYLADPDGPTILADMVDTQDIQPPSRALSGQQIAQAAGLLIGGVVLSRVLGMVRDAVIAGIFGGGAAFEAYLAASRPPETLFYVVAGGGLASAFIPTITNYLEKKDEKEAWRMANAVLTLIVLIMLGLAGLVALFARPIVATVLAPGFAEDPGQLALTARLMQVMMLSPVIFAISGLIMGVLNAHQRFLLPAFAPALYNVGILFGAVALTPSLGIYGLAWGVVIGAALHLLIQLPGLAALHAPARPVLDLADPGVREVARLMGPRVLGLAIVQVNFWVNIALASDMVEGSVAALGRAWVVFLLPQGVIAQSVANAVFPTFSIHAARGETGQLRATLGQVIRAVLFLAIPASVGLIVLRAPVVRLLFERGAFTPADTQATAWALLFYGLGLVAHSLVEIVTRAYYAMHDTRTPVLIGGAAMALNVVLSLALIRVMGDPGSLVRGPFAGLALANTLATTLEGALLVAFIRGKVGGLDWPRIGASVGRAGAASVVMGLALWAALPAVRALGQYAGPVIAIAGGGALFWGLAYLIGSPEARLFTDMALRRLRRA
jgi:putative peptidoglycan lipid II flippase